MNVNEHNTSDLNEAVLMAYFGHKLVCVDRTNKRAVFYFRKEDNTEELLSAYRERSLMVEPYMFYQCSKGIKDRLYNG